SGLATSLRMEGGKSYSRLTLLADLLKQMEIFYNVLIEQGSAAIARQWEASSTFAHGKRVRVRRGNGEDFGTTAGMEPTGALRVRLDDGRLEALVAGEVVELK
ncbi:MAG: biotin--[acetyl-CoA-carboxylase] ligase, partial [Terriglobia bacterium]